MNTHKVLRHLQTVISQNELSLDLWHTLLQVFLAIGDTVLSPSYQSMNHFIFNHYNNNFICEIY